mmetsp:Transcript_19528/g.35708  ORF Transcript_19528/g.35708 Transcript_19528/m.35708 type:complete len:310 (-) Transcript_19528:2060-2989(-)
MRITDFDFFRRAPADHSKQTFTGGLFTFAAMVFMSVLLASELTHFLGGSIRKETIVQQGEGGSKMPVNVNITFTEVPCSVIALNYADTVQHVEMNIQEFISYTRLDADGEPVVGRSDDVSAAIAAREQCRIEGYALINRAPGNLSIDFRAKNAALRNLSPDQVRKLRLSHTINHFSFGKVYKNDYITKTFGAGDHTRFFPYDSLTMKAPDTGVTNFDYFLRIIPVQYLDETSGDFQTSFSFSLTSQQRSVQSSSAQVMIQFEFESITMKYSVEAKSWGRFLTHLCAILGGVFAVLGLVNTLTQQFGKAN